MEKRLVEILACPLCKIKLTYSDGALLCNNCKQIYRCIDTIPNFLPEELIEKYNSDLKQQDLQEEMGFYQSMYRDLKGLDDGHCVVYGYEKIYDFMEGIPKGSLLDIGCGAGHHSKDLSMLGYEVTGIDISVNGLKHALSLSESNNQDIGFVLGDIENLPFEDNSFDIVFCSLILHHFPRRQKLLKEISRVCRKHFVTFEVNSYDLISFIRFNIINPTIGIPNITKNQRTVSPIKLEKELRNLGFSSIDIKYEDVHHNIGRYPDSKEAKMLSLYKKTTRFLPLRYQCNKFIMKGRKA